MQIQIVNVEISTKPTAKGSYQIAEVAFKNLATGKLEGKKIMSFTNKEVFSEIAGAKGGDVFDVSTEKDDKGYWQWVSVKKSTGGGAQPSTANRSFTGQASSSTIKSTYETPEERAKKQIYIVRQSSISAAITLLSVGSKSAPDVAKVLEVAKLFEDHVFGTSSNSSEESIGKDMMLPTTSDEFNDDIPF